MLAIERLSCDVLLPQDLPVLRIEDDGGGGADVRNDARRGVGLEPRRHRVLQRLKRRRRWTSRVRQPSARARAGPSGRSDAAAEYTGAAADRRGAGAAAGFAVDAAVAADFLCVARF